MTIKEIEQITQLTRANIRFYESEGLISPARDTNGYRNYSEEDANTLIKIKLLRNLQISIEDIKLLQDGYQKLHPILTKSLQSFDIKTEEISHAKTICEVMQADNANYDTLNTSKYLALLNSNHTNTQIKQDVIPRENMSARRFFARMLDWYLIRFTIFGLLYFGLQMRPANVGFIGQILIALLTSLITLFTEPILISKLGTTLGKWILGIRIEDLDGGRLTYDKAVNRTAAVIASGMGLGLPVFTWVRIYNSWHALIENRELPWETDSILVRKRKIA